MNPIDAYNHLCLYLKDTPVVARCSEYTKYYGFYIVPPGTDYTEPVFASRPILVNKDTGKVLYFDEYSNRILGRGIRNIDVSLFNSSRFDHSDEGNSFFHWYYRTKMGRHHT